MVQQTPVTFKSDGLTLEGVYYTPDSIAPAAAAVVCHPHPGYGGDMYNLVVTVIVRGLIEAGMGALAFNFRGVEGSEGFFDGGKGERDDVLAAVAFVRTLPGIERVALAGYSFGAAMAAAAADPTIPALALVALPVSMARDGVPALESFPGPVLLVSGANDDISPEPDLRKLAASLTSPPTLVIVPAADHFWWGQERPLAGAIRDFFATKLG